MKIIQRNTDEKQQSNNNYNKVPGDAKKILVATWVSSSSYNDCDSRGEGVLVLNTKPVLVLQEGRMCF